MDWHIVFYKDKFGNEPVKTFILRQPYTARAEIIHVLDLLHKFNFSLGFPYVKKISGNVWELRIKYSSNHYRILYFTATNRNFILLHAIRKTTNKLPQGDIDIAFKRMRDHLNNL